MGPSWTKVKIVIHYLKEKFTQYDLSQVLLTDTCGEALAETSFLPEVDEWSDLNLAGDELVGEAGDPGVSLRSLQCEIRLDYKVSELATMWN